MFFLFFFSFLSRVFVSLFFFAFALFAAVTLSIRNIETVRPFQKQSLLRPEGWPSNDQLPENRQQTSRSKKSIETRRRDALDRHWYIATTLLAPTTLPRNIITTCILIFYPKKKKIWCRAVAFMRPLPPFRTLAVEKSLDASTKSGP